MYIVTIVDSTTNSVVMSKMMSFVASDAVDFSREMNEYFATYGNKYKLKMKSIW